MLTSYEFDRKMALKALTPLHSAAEAAMTSGEDVGHKPVPGVCHHDEEDQDQDEGAAVTDPATGKSYEFLNSARPVISAQDIGPGGLFAKSYRDAPCGPGSFPRPNAAPDPGRFRGAPISEGRAANGPAYGQPRTMPMPGNPQVDSVSHATPSEACTTRLPGSGD
jgi:hypothetical protein